MEICFEGIGQVVVTFRTEDELLPGMAVSLTDNGTVGLDGSGDAVCGVTVGAARGGAVAVQIGGVVKVGYAGGETLNVGWQELACDGKGKVTAGGDGGSCLVLAVDEDEKSVVVKL